MNAEKDVMKVRSALRRKLDSLARDRAQLNGKLMRLNTEERETQIALSLSDDELMRSYSVEVHTIDVATMIKRLDEAVG